ncbi:MAG: hypothetical protein M1827_006590 [Pycnora praestabilis]|nr:MAG: hypothetical protein M1827_006590 [Pycnora praestabilis]
MPRAALPPTPISSTDISGKDNSKLSSNDLSFTLPPPAIAGRDSGRSSTASTKSTSESSYRPASPTSPKTMTHEHGSTRRRALGTQAAVNKDDFTLPPPPTRSRKIIQMKPRPQEQPQAEQSQSAPPTSGKNTAPTQSGGKKKQPSSTSVAGRKIARKTAHSLIERRRRSKMNEEFGVLKDMIPACKDQEMHKLAILQASIEYLRYLEQCVTDLKANSHQTVPTYTPASHQPCATSPSNEEDEDLEMEESPAPTPSTLEPQHHYACFSHSNTTSPALDSQRRHYSYSSMNSTLPSPMFEAQRHYSDTSNSNLTSPALLPQSDDLRNFDHEATAALLMLNTDRRSVGGRGMSVKDLLSA